MMLNKYVKIIIFGCILWIIPFLAGFLLYSSKGQPLFDIFLIKSIMIAIGSLTGIILLILYFKKISINYLREGVVVGISWLFINWLLDILILLPMNKMSINIYFMNIGIRYLSILFVSVSVGYLLDFVKKHP
ncbi:MAG: hypothetical protein PVI75_00400 [Gammaproteobacteria bacterium]